ADGPWVVDDTRCSPAEGVRPGAGNICWSLAGRPDPTEGNHVCWSPLGRSGAAGNQVWWSGVDEPDPADPACSRNGRDISGAGEGRAGAPGLTAGAVGVAAATAAPPSAARR